MESIRFMIFSLSRQSVQFLIIIISHLTFCHQTSPYLGTGTFGRVYLCKLLTAALSDGAKAPAKYFAMKVLRKVEVVRLKQVEHVISERNILGQINYPFIVNMQVEER